MKRSQKLCRNVKILNRADIIVDDNFIYNVAFDIVNENDDLDPKSVDEYRNRHDWPSWKSVIKKS